MTNVLIVDDENALCTILAETVSQEGWSPVCAHNLGQAQKQVNNDTFDIVLLDIKLPDGNGLEVLPEFVNSTGKPEVIIMTGYGDAESAELALQYGAWDYIKKPFSQNKINLSIQRALEYRQAKQAGRKHRILKRNGIVGASIAINDILEQTAELAEGDHSVLITGETGTGKELFARAIHLNSHRANRHFIVVDCTALSETLIENSLFGHVKGAYTDARQDRQGLIQLAHQGTLFLDEICELSLEIQKKFLRVLEEKKFRQIGSTKEQESDFRLVSATNRDLEEMVEKGTFRSDLLYRIKSQKLTIPPLRDHKEDLPELISHYMSKICRRMSIKAKNIQPEFMECLYAYDWPGNIRELINVLDQAICTAREIPTLFHKHLPMNIRSAVIRQQTDSAPSPAPAPELFRLSADDGSLSSWQDYRNAAEKKYFEQLVEVAGGNIREMEKIAGMGKSRIYELIHKHNLAITKPRGQSQ